MTALKAALWEAYQESGKSGRQLARELHVGETEVRRMLNPDHATKVRALEIILRHLGVSVSITINK